MGRADPSRCDVERAKNGIYVTRSARIKTYENWPKNQVQDPSDLADAGFYYTGKADQVKCFYCDGGLEDWNKCDIPSVEHEKFFPHCAFIKQRNTQDVISERRKSEKAVICKQTRNLANKEYHQSQISVEEPPRRAIYVKPDTYDTGQPDLPQPNLVDKHSTDILPAETVNFASASPEELERQRSLRQLREEYKILRAMFTCKICWKCEACILFLPCADLVACEFCSGMLLDCPVCESTIVEKVKTYRC